MTTRAPYVAKPLAVLAACAVLATPAGASVATEASLAVGQVITDVVITPLVHDLTKVTRPPRQPTPNERPSPQR
jgi:hypothetical protein